MLERPKIYPSQQPQSLGISPSKLASKLLGMKIEHGQVTCKKKSSDLVFKISDKKRAQNVLLSVNNSYMGSIKDRFKFSSGNKQCVFVVVYDTTCSTTVIVASHKSVLNLARDIPYLTPLGELWDVHCEHWWH